MRGEPWLRYLLAAAMVFAGAMHFVRPEFYLRIMPAFLPRAWDMPLIDASGVFEILGGIGLLVERSRAFAAWGLIALFIAVFPANVNMAVNRIGFGRRPWPVWALWARLPLQAVLVAWAAWFTR